MTQKENIIKEFRNIWEEINKCPCCGSKELSHICGCSPEVFNNRKNNIDTIENFWLSKLDTQLQEIIEMAEGMKKEEPPIEELKTHPEGCQCYRNRAGYNQALSDLIHNLKSLQK